MSKSSDESEIKLNTEGKRTTRSDFWKSCILNEKQISLAVVKRVQLYLNAQLFGATVSKSFDTFVVCGDSAMMINNAPLRTPAPTKDLISW